MGNSICSTGTSAGSTSKELELNVEGQKVRAKARKMPHARKDDSSATGTTRVGSLVEADSQLFLLLEQCCYVPAGSQSSSLSCSCAASEKASPVRNRPFVRCWAKAADGTVLGKVEQWPARSNTMSPTWFSARPLGTSLSEHPGAILRLELWDGATLLGCLDANLGNLPGHHDETMAFEMQDGVSDPPATITFQVLDSAALSFASKTVYFVRHGESVWNNAQSKGLLHEMAAELDHPLSAKGAEQAEALRRRIEAGRKTGDAAATELCSPGVLYVSPLCRAVQTGLIALGPSQAASGGEFVLMATAREKQNLGGFDSMSNRKGTEILHGTVEGMKRLYGTQPDKLRECVDTFKKVNFDVHEAEEDWWCEGTSDSSEMLHHRLQEFMAQILYTPHETAVVVGHSHFFRSVFKSCLSEEFGAVNKTLAKDIVTKKLCNCGVVKMQLDPRRGVEGKPIISLELVLGTTLDSDGGMRDQLNACCAAPGHVDDRDAENTLVLQGESTGPMKDPMKN